MLREVKNAQWTVQGMWFWKRYVFVAGKVCQARGWKPQALAEAELVQREGAVPVLQLPNGRTYWWCLDKFFWEDDELGSADVYALVFERQLRAQRKLEQAHAVVARAEIPVQRREPVPRDVRHAVWERDHGKCVECDSSFDLQYDHVIPVVMGGATSIENLQLLCGDCNRRKGGTLG